MRSVYPANPAIPTSDLTADTDPFIGERVSGLARAAFSAWSFALVLIFVRVGFVFLLAIGALGLQSGGFRYNVRHRSFAARFVRLMPAIFFCSLDSIDQPVSQHRRT